ncbi:MAG: hypothetical protein E7423_08955 [Ruminococcaceae bacterium]|jgi:hypothetical protein|nr:hypothetical protein [Oscillospiraceae bacterium]
MTHKTRRLVSVLFALIAAAFLLPASVHAAETDPYVRSVAVTIDAPFVWARPDYTAEFPAGAHYYCSDYTGGELLNDVKWRDLTANRWMIPNKDTFELGHQYRVDVYLTAEEGYTIVTNADGTINGKTAQHHIDPYSNQYVLSYTFPEVTKHIASVSITLDSPIVGEKPDYTAQFPGGSFYYTAAINDTYSRSDITWGDATMGTFMTPDVSVFQSGRAYQVVVLLTPMDTFWFTSSTTATVNDHPAKAEILSNQLLVTYTFDSAAQPVSSVSITLDSPVGGAHPDYKAELPSGVRYFITPSADNSLRDDIDWYEPAVSEFTPLDPNTGVFQTGHEYEVVIYLSAQDGYAFTAGTTAQINGSAARAGRAGTQLYVSFLFSPAPTPIPAVSVTLDEPEAGAHPDFTAVLPSGANYYSSSQNGTYIRNDILWRNADEDTLLKPDTDVFETGHAYEVTIYLSARSGYAFAPGAAAQVNGMTANAEVVNGQLKIRYTFPTLLEPIVSASVTLDAPAAGTRPDFDAEFPAGAPYYTDENHNGSYLRNDIQWKCLTSDAALSPDYDWFGVSKQYAVTVWLTPREGYAFRRNTAATINGYAAAVELLSDGRLKASYTFPTIEIIPISHLELSLGVPAADVRPDYNPVLPEGAPYSPSGINWFDEDANVTLDRDGGDVFQYGHRYRVNIFLDHAYGYEFTDDITATLNGETAYSRTFSEDTAFVSVLFPALPNSIPSVSVTLDAPEADAHPDFTATLPSGANYYSSSQNNGVYLRNDILWRNADEDTLLKPDTDVFETGYAYEVTIYLSARSGNVFTSDTTAQVNGKTARAEVVNGQLKIKYTFPALPKPTYTITWKNDDGTVLETDTGVARGTMPTYNGPTPVKAPTDKFTYTFRGWRPAIQAATEDKTYTATFTEKPICSVSGTVSGDSLTYSVTAAPGGAVLIAARYDSGRMTWLQTVSSPAASGSLTMKGSGSDCKLFLVDGTSFRPLCSAWTR